MSLSTYIALDREARSLGGRIARSATDEEKAALRRRLTVVRLRLAAITILNDSDGVVLTDDEAAEVIGTLRGAA